MNELEKDVMDMCIAKLKTIYELDTEADSFGIACQIWEDANINGTITYSTYEAEQWIIEHFSDLREYVEDAKDEEFLTIDPFINPEGFMVQIVIYITRILLSPIEDDEHITKEKLKYFLTSHE